MKKKIVSVMLTAAMTVGMMTTGSLNMVAAEEANSDEEAITALLYGDLQRIRQRRTDSGFRQCAISSTKLIRTGI